MSVIQPCSQEFCALTWSLLANDARFPLSRERTNGRERARIGLHGFRIWLIVVTSLLTSIFKILELFISSEILATFSCHYLKIETFRLPYFTREVLICARLWVQFREGSPALVHRTGGQRQYSRIKPPLCQKCILSWVKDNTLPSIYVLNRYWHIEGKLL